MIRNIVAIILILAVMLGGLNVYASSKADKSSDNDYYSNYFEDEGRLLFKLRLVGMNANFKQKSLPAPTSGTTATASSLVKNGFGGDAATTVFFNDNLAAELSLGFVMLRTKAASMNDINQDYNGTATNIKRRNIYMLPVTFTGQYHIAPFGAVRPYLGIGGYGAYMFSRAKEFKIKSGYGLVFQAGVDLVAKDDTFITLDIKNYMMKTKVTYKGAVVNNAQGISSKIKVNPLVLSIGLGFKF